MNISNMEYDDTIIPHQDIKLESKDDIHINDFAIEEIKKEFQEAINKNSSDIAELKIIITS